MRKLYHIISFLSALLLVAGCGKGEFQPIQTSLEERIGEASCSEKVAVSIKVGLSSTRSSYDFYDTQISSIFIAAYHNGRLQDSFASSTYNEEEICLNLYEGKTYEIYALASCGTLEEFDLTDESDVRSLALDMSPTEYEGFPMCCHAVYRVRAPYTLEMEYERMVSKWEFSIDHSALPDLRVTGIRVRNCAGRLFPFRGTGPQKNGQVNAQDGDFCSAEDLAAIRRGESVTFFVPENLQGNLLPDNVGQYDRTCGRICDEGFDPSRCTYLEISGEFDQSGNRPPFRGEILYRFYLGENYRGNFDVVRNTIHSARFTPSLGSATNEIEWLVDNSGVKVNVYGGLKIYSTDESSEELREITGDQITLIGGLSRGRLKVIWEDEGFTSDVTDQVEWRLPSSTRLNIEDGGWLGALEADGAGEELVEVDYQGLTASFGAKILNVELPEVDFSLTDYSGTGAIPTGLLTDPRSGAACTAFSSTYRKLKIDLDSLKDWEEMQAECTGSPAFEFSEEYDLAQEEAFSITMDFMERGVINGRAENFELSEQAAGNRLSLVLWSVEDEWGRRKRGQIDRDFIFAFEVGLCADITVRFSNYGTGPFYPYVRMFWAGRDDIGGNSLSQNYNCQSQMFFLQQMPIWFELSNLSGHTFYFSSECEFDLRDESNCRNLVSAFAAGTTRIWRIPYSKPGLNVVTFDFDQSALPLWISTCENCEFGITSIPSCYNFLAGGNP